ncbi:MAG: SET domain-containing protein [Verrucomicrobiota bacterium]
MIEARPSRIHGQGLFALQTFRPGERVVEYRGERLDLQEGALRLALGNDALCQIGAGAVLDGGGVGNLARWANHACLPNAEMVESDGHLWLVARALLRAGTEITFDYGYDLTDWRSFPCRCGADSCAGFIVAEPFRANLRRLCLAAGIFPGPG